MILGLGCAGHTFLTCDVQAGAKEGKLMLKKGAAWESVFLSCAGKSILYYKNQLAQKPLSRLAVTDLKSVQAVDGSRNEFVIHVIGGGEASLHR